MSKELAVRTVMENTQEKEKKDLLKDRNRLS